MSDVKRVDKLVVLNGFKVPSNDLFKEVEGREVFLRYVSERSGNIVDLFSATRYGYEKKVTRAKTGEVFWSYKSWTGKPPVAKEVIKDGKVYFYNLFTSRGRKSMLKVSKLANIFPILRGRKSMLIASKLANIFRIPRVPVPKANWVLQYIR